ncbi:MAG: MFS transporter [Steroidobacteraceae bacterium]
MYNSRNPVVVVAVALILNVVGPSAFNIMPLLAEGAVHTLGFADRQIGVMSMAISIGSGASALLAGVWVRSVQWHRAALFALGGMFAANTAALIVHAYWAFVLLQGLAGFFGGSVLCLAFTILSDRAESARSFGIAAALQTAYQVAGLLTGPALLEMAGLNGVVLMLAGLSGMAMILTPLLPSHGRTVTAAGMPRVLLSPATFIALVGMGTYFANAGGYWTYIELIGQAHGMTSRVVTNSIAAGVSAGIVGGLLAWALGDRFGKLLPLGLASILTVIAALLTNATDSAGGFTLSCALYYFAWNYSLAYQLAIINRVDPTGRAVAISGAFAYLGAAGGAGLAALFVTPGDYRSVAWLVAANVCLSFGCYGLSCAVHRHQASVRSLSV